MKLYRKQLDSLEALKREKIRLRYERTHTKASDLNPLTNIAGSKLSGFATGGVLGIATELLSSKSNMQTALTIGKPLLRMLRNRKAKKRDIRKAAGLPEKESLVHKVMKEVAINYLIGKAVQISLQGLQGYMRKKKVALLRK